MKNYRLLYTYLFYNGMENPFSLYQYNIDNYNFYSFR